MPVHDLGYRSWQGSRTPRILRPLVVARSGVSLVLRRRWLRIGLMLAWLPIIFPALGIFAFEFSATQPGMREGVLGFWSGPMGRPDLGAEAISDPESARHEIWSTLIFVFFRYPQLFAMMMLVGLVAPMLVSYDFRSKAYLQYFSRPLSPVEYILGKSAVVWFLLVMTITIPALVLYAIGVLLSPELSVVKETWDIPLRILAATVVLVVPTTALALCYSSLTSESRYASFAWFATWIMGYVAYNMLTLGGARGGGRRRRGGPAWEEIDWDRWRLLSPFNTLGKVESWVFDLQQTPGSVVPAVVLLVVVTVAGTWIVRRRIIAKLRV